MMYSKSGMMKAIATMLVAFVVASLTNAQIEYLPVENITAGWTGSASPVSAGNGVFLSPDGALAVVIGRDASVTAFDAALGPEVWTYPAPSTTAVAEGGIFFCYTTTVPYLVFSYYDANGQSYVLNLSRGIY
jgi:outer membrane protein assembly factor BamB